mmetsp:Transcript_106700/g.299806  ORF Transcript_106700/g.299806 Transcript_106700/m.299806 type:complete len:343 (+) Transcript_106700:352-1380(+)
MSTIWVHSAHHSSKRVLDLQNRRKVMRILETKDSPGGLDSGSAAACWRWRRAGTLHSRIVAAAGILAGTRIGDRTFIIRSVLALGEQETHASHVTALVERKLAAVGRRFARHGDREQIATAGPVPTKPRFPRKSNPASAARGSGEQSPITERDVVANLAIATCATCRNEHRVSLGFLPGVVLVQSCALAGGHRLTLGFGLVPFTQLQFRCRGLLRTLIPPIHRRCKAESQGAVLPAIICRGRELLDTDSGKRPSWNCQAEEATKQRWERGRDPIMVLCDGVVAVVGPIEAEDVSRVSERECRLNEQLENPAAQLCDAHLALQAAGTTKARSTPKPRDAIRVE